MNYLHTFPIFILSLLVISCNYNPIDKQKIIGNWVIENGEYNNQNVHSFLRINLITFKNNKCGIPKFNDSDYEETDWLLIDEGDNYYLKIFTENPIFKSKFQINFIKDNQKKIISMILKSSSVEIKCNKLLYHFDSNPLNY